MTIVNSSYNLPFKMASSGYQRVMFGYQYLIVANHCHTALWTVKLTVAQQVLFFLKVRSAVSINSCPINTFVARSPIFPCTSVSYVNTHTEHISIYPILSGTEATIKLFPHCSHLTNIHSTVPPAVSVATPQLLCSHNSTQWLTCFHALHKDNFKKTVILLLRSFQLKFRRV